MASSTASRPSSDTKVSTSPHHHLYPFRLHRSVQWHMAHLDGESHDDAPADHDKQGIIPYAAVNFATYEGLKTLVQPEGDLSVTQKLFCGGLAGAIGQTSE